MFDFAFSELILIAVVALVVVGPKDLPVVLRHVMKFVRELRAVYLGLKTQMHQVMEEAGVNDMMHGTTTIIDLEGKPQKAYDVSELTQLQAPVVPPPTGGRLGGGQLQSADLQSEQASAPLPSSPRQGEENNGEGI